MGRPVVRALWPAVAGPAGEAVVHPARREEVHQKVAVLEGWRQEGLREGGRQTVLVRERR